MVFDAQPNRRSQQTPHTSESGDMEPPDPKTRLMESEARFRSLFENASDGILLFDAQGIIGDANPSMLAMLGCALEMTIRRDRKSVV